MVKGVALGVNEIEATVVLEEGAGSLPTVDPSFVGIAITQADGSVLTPCGEEISLGKNPFVWPYLVASHEAPFKVNNAAEHAM